MTWLLTVEKNRTKISRIVFSSFFKALSKALIEKRLNSNLLQLWEFLLKNGLYFQDLLSLEILDTEKLIRKKIFLIFSRILRNFSRFFFFNIFFFSFQSRLWYSMRDTLYVWIWQHNLTWSRWSMALIKKCY